MLGRKQPIICDIGVV